MIKKLEEQLIMLQSRADEDNELAVKMVELLPMVFKIDK
jgi:hypothetical protein